MNIIDKIYQKATNENWCTKAFCTTCGSFEFNNITENELKANSEVFIDDLRNCDFDVLAQKEDWTGGLYRIFQNIEVFGRKTEILDFWLNRSNISGHQYNSLFFFLVRHSESNDIKDIWTRKLTHIAKQTKNGSIVESLLIDLKDKVKYFPELCNLVETEYLNETKIQRLYKN